MNNVLQKWESTGLLQTSVNKQSMAEMLDATSNVLFSSAESFKDIKSVAGMCIPVLVKALHDKNFVFNINDSSFAKEVISVSVPDNSEEESQLCESAAKQLSEKIAKYANLNIHGVDVVPENNSFKLEVRCS